LERSPSSPASWPPDAFPAGASIAAAVGAIVVYIATLIVLLPTFHVTPELVRAMRLSPPIVEAQVAGYVPILIYMAVVLPHIARRSLREILGPLGLRQVFAGFAGAAMMWLVVEIVGGAQSAIFGHPPTQTAVRLFENANHGLWLDVMIAVAVTLGPFAEELVFRGFLFNALWQRFSFAPSAVISALVFGAAHGQLAGIVPLAAGGVVLAGVYARTGSLWSSTIAHGTFNGLTLILLFVAGIKT
jgi:membrane protease YdiL (CAAX protease family)